jgi:hypothetical protein
MNAAQAIMEMRTLKVPGAPLYDEVRSWGSDPPGCTRPCPPPATQCRKQGQWCAQMSIA